jgi:hypothetical protein
VLVLFAIVIIVLLGMCALAIDLGVLYTAATDAQAVADAAALAGASAWRDTQNRDAAVAAAVQIAGKNAILGQPYRVDVNKDIVVGSWDTQSQTVVPWDETRGDFAIQVTARRTEHSPSGPVPTFFARVFGRQAMNVSRTAVAGLDVDAIPRPPVQMMLVQDGTSSFQEAWPKAIEADMALVKLINGVAVSHDQIGMVTFNAALPDSWTKANRPTGSTQTYYQLYAENPGMNSGIKYTTDIYGKPVKTDKKGYASSTGQVRSMTSELIALNPDMHTTLPANLDNAGQLLENGKAWGDTDTAVGLNYAIDRLAAQPTYGDKVIVLVSDGKPHDVRGASYTKQKEDAAVVAADRAGAAGIIIYTVTLEGNKGVNYKFNEGLIRNGGVAFRANSADELYGLLIGIGKMMIGHSRLYK